MDHPVVDDRDQSIDLQNARGMSSDPPSTPVKGDLVPSAWYLVPDAVTQPRHTSPRSYSYARMKSPSGRSSPMRWSRSINRGQIL